MRIDGADAARRFRAIFEQGWAKARVVAEHADTDLFPSLNLLSNDPGLPEMPAGSHVPPDEETAAVRSPNPHKNVAMSAMTRSIVPMLNRNHRRRMDGTAGMGRSSDACFGASENKGTD